MESLETLESKVRRLVEVVAELREELAREREGRRSMSSESDSLRARVAELTAEMNALRGERETVRQRLEKLLEHIDAASAG